MTYSFEAEQAVIGAILLDPKLIERCINVISPKDFYVQMHKSIFEEMLLKFRNDQKIDYVTILASFGSKVETLSENGPSSFADGVNN